LAEAACEVGDDLLGSRDLPEDLGLSASAPVIAVIRESRSSMSPRAISTPLASSPEASELGPTTARTGFPRSWRASTTLLAEVAGATDDENECVAHGWLS
jgi:hypothetical protein